MLSKITLITSLGIATVYPLSFWISVKEPLRCGFSRFHLGMPLTVGAVTCIFLLGTTGINPALVSLWVWLILLTVLSFWAWRADHLPTPLLAAVSVAGIWGYYAFLRESLALSGMAGYVTILGAAILSASLYAMNLGHWYLNVHGLSLSHIRRATKVFLLLLCVRLLWDSYALAFHQIVYRWETVPLWKFLLTMDGMLLSMGILFGTIFPLISSLFALETIRLKNTQSATGILYVILCGVLIGDMTYKYFLLKHGVVM